ncbi:MAG TPA: GNAT family protein [Candidatus Krumholzibacteria bacterium]|nr:GNAT family protein [Candidatus Krumholzibacteria bacterium]
MRIDIGSICIRSYEKRDSAAVHKYANNPNVSRHLRDSFPYPYTRRDALRWVAAALAQEEETNFAIANAAELIGGIGFVPQMDVHRKSAEIGYWLGEPFWGRGIVTRAVSALVAHAFENSDLVRLYAYVFAGNPASERVLEKNGFVCEGVLRQSVLKNGTLLDQKLFALLRDGYRREPSSTR